MIEIKKLNNIYQVKVNEKEKNISSSDGEDEGANGILIKIV